MSEPSIPLFNGDLKPVTLGDVIRLAERTNKGFVANFHLR